MSTNRSPEHVLGAVRAYMAPVVPRTRRAPRARPRAQGWPELVLLIDTETSTDAAQRLRFGSYRLCKWEQDSSRCWRLVCIEEGLFYGDELPKQFPPDLRALQAYVRGAFADTADLTASRLALYSRRDFADKVLWRAVAQGRALICGFNLPFDLSRLAVGWGDARPRDDARRFARGFSFQLWDWWNPETQRCEDHPFRPRLLIRHEDSKRARLAWGTCRGQALVGAGKTRKRYTGHFLDLKTLAFALTGEPHSLASAAKAFRTAHRKTEADYAARITAEYIGYNRQDVRVTLELLEALRAEFDLHPIDADPWQLRSPASLAKGYLRACGITPLRARARAVPEWVLGAAMEAYFGGRTECHLPRDAGPVVYTDFLSMYPTVQTLAHLSEWLTAGELRARVCTADAERVLKAVSVERCLAPDLWPDLRFFALVDPRDDVLPFRAQYAPDSESFSIGVNRVTSRIIPLWYTGFDLAASMLMTGRVPRIRKAVTLRTEGKAATLRRVKLRGQVTLDPRTNDIFRAVVELRYRVKRDAALPEEDKKRLGDVLKALANSGSYGIFAEMNPQDLPNGEMREVRVIGGSQRFTTNSTKPEQVGEHCFPPIAALVTGAARLLLALLERLVRDAGGSYALCDTDSFAIIASESGGFLPCPCPGGSETGPTGEPGVRVLSWAQVREIVRQIDALKPYGSEVPDSLLKIEDENFRNGTQVQLYAYGLSAKRYCLFVEGPNGPDIVKASEHGLGHLLNPTDPEDANRGPSKSPKWIEEVWRGFVLQNRGQRPSQFPSWFARPAVARHGFTSPALIQPLHRSQGDRPYCEQVKPFNFALTCYVTPDGAPAGTEPATHLIAPFERDARKWLNQDWCDTASGTVCRIESRATTSRRVARVKSVADIVADYASHTDAKSAGPHGERTGPATVGLLQRRHVEPVYIFRIGKESNRYEDVERGQVRTLEEVQEILEHPRATVWATVYLPLLNAIPARQLEAETGVPESLLIRYRKGLVKPSPRQMRRLVAALRDHLADVGTRIVRQHPLKNYGRYVVSQP